MNIIKPSSRVRIRNLIFVFSRLRAGADATILKTARTAYVALAQSVISYCIVVWGATGKTKSKATKKGSESGRENYGLKTDIRYPKSCCDFWGVLYSLAIVTMDGQL